MRENDKIFEELSNLDTERQAMVLRYIYGRLESSESFIQVIEDGINYASNVK